MQKNHSRARADVRDCSRVVLLCAVGCVFVCVFVCFLVCLILCFCVPIRVYVRSCRVERYAKPGFGNAFVSAVRSKHKLQPDGHT